jgi:hypothetical protein
VTSLSQSALARWLMAILAFLGPLMLSVDQTGAAAHAISEPEIWMSSHQTVDFMVPYQQPRTWANVAKHVNVIELPSAFVGRMSDKQLMTIFHFVDNHKIEFGIEAPLVTPGKNGCGDRVEGFAAEGTVEHLAARIKSLGGTLSIIGMMRSFSSAISPLVSGCRAAVSAKSPLRSWHKT